MIDPNDEWVELCRSSEGEVILAQRESLQVAGIATSEGVAGTSSNLGEAYGAWNNNPNEGVIKVRRRDFEKARSVLESGLELVPLPDDHYLNDFSEDELIDLLADQNAWSAFDVAHAKRIAGERDLDLSQVSRLREDLVEKRSGGKPAPEWLIVIGWLMVFGGGLVGVGIGWSLAYMEDKTPSGTYPTYNERARETGKKMLSWGVLMTALWYQRDFVLKVLNLH